MNRRQFLQTALAGSGALWLPAQWTDSSPFQAPPQPATFPVKFRKPSPYESVYAYIESGHDEFPEEKRVEEITALLHRAIEARSFPLGTDFQGLSPLPVRYKTIESDSREPAVRTAVFDAVDRPFADSARHWIESLGQIRSLRFYVTQIELGPGDRANVRVRFEIVSWQQEELHYRVGQWKQVWVGDRLSQFEPLEETLATATKPLFSDVTQEFLGNADSFQRQLRRGVPYWRGRLDSASGIDVYGNNGIAVGDIDGDGQDEIYVCQPGGLPNRLYQSRQGRLEDVTERAGVGVLDDTSSALFVDFRNSGLQDLLVLRSGGPLLFLNQGDGRFQSKPDAFRFARPPQGTFTGMAAADFDNDGHVDVYLCCYIYFQSEDQYRYPAPYHDAQNGPPNFLFRNQLSPEGRGFFEDVTEPSGMNQNNNRYSFAPAWCDYDGDGWPDLYVANDFGRSNLYRNQKGQFEDVGKPASAENIGPGMSASWFDCDGDGRLDLYVGNMWTAAGQRMVRHKEFLPAKQGGVSAYHGHTRGNALYRNRGDGTFEERSAQEGVEMGRWAWSADALDFDNDGSPEIYVTCGMISSTSQKDLSSFFWRQVVARTPNALEPAPRYENGWNALNQLIREDYSWNGREPNVFYARRGDRYYDLSGISGLDLAEDSRAFAATDLDGDGSLDLLLKSRLGPQLRVFRNECGAQRQSMALRLIGTKSNRDAIGARVDVGIADCRLPIGDCQQKRTLSQFVRAGSGYLSQHTKTLYFGLGEATVASQVTVQWPSGLIQEFQNLAAGFRYQIVEGKEELKKTPFLVRKEKSGANRQSAIGNRQSPNAVQGDNIPQLQETWLLEPIPLPQKHVGPAFVCLTGPRPATQVEGVPFELVDLTKATPDTAAVYSLFRRYLFDWRADLVLPLVFLIDSEGLAHKVYPSVPLASALRADMEKLRASQRDPSVRQRLALPFEGQYYTQPARRYFQLGAAFLSAGYPDQALQYLNEIVRQTPANYKAQLAIGQIHLEAGRLDEAKRALETARELNPQSPEVWNNLGGVQAARGNYTEALTLYEKALSFKATLPYVLNNAAQAYAKTGDRANAEKLFRRALELDSQDADTANQLGLLLAQQNRTVEARQLFQQAIAVRRDHAGAINNLGVLYSQMNQVNDAIAAFQYGIGVAPDSDSLYLNLARLYVRLQQRIKAQDTLQQLLRRKPNHPVATQALQQLDGLP